MSPLPSGPWTDLSMDFCGPFPSGDYLMVVMDEYSRYPIVDILKSTSAKAVIPKLDKIFAEFGIPKILKTDNGPPFNGTEFRQYSEYLGFSHRKITPLWPKANAESERFMRTIEKTIKAANVEHKSWKQEIFTFLRNYRATPHCTTKTSPFEALFSRKIRTKMEVDILKENKGGKCEIHNELKENDIKAKLKMKQHADHYSRVKEIDLEVGDNVLVKQPKTSKLSTPYEPNPLEILKTKGTMVTAGNGEKTITRNASHFKKIESNKADQDEEPEIDIEIPTKADNTASDIPSRPKRVIRTPKRLIEEMLTHTRL
ncbi:uncharacterized protein K02A2.6-like [Saccostrea echinata]|uniref:uncharacterized protein K02A2.6-like n=1 Tax=Saccostrea echinata TaxID=191078 RepID=UPI002A7F2F5E|nr:uncharacterized protein K02A2.6-like [Saccostrea echinata]